MALYTVQWGAETKIVEADSPKDAWSNFADGHDLAGRQPKLHERKVALKKAVPVPVAATVVKTVDVTTNK